MKKTEEKRKASRERIRRWREENPDKAMESYREQYEKHREKILESKRVYYQEVRKPQDKTPLGRLKDRLKKSKRRQLEQVGSPLTVEEWGEICEEFNWRCAHCGSQLDNPEQDHFLPLSRGGLHVRDNVIPSCKPCNSSKGASMPSCLFYKGGG